MEAPALEFTKGRRTRRLKVVVRKRANIAINDGTIVRSTVKGVAYLGAATWCSGQGRCYRAL